MTIDNYKFLILGFIYGIMTAIILLGITISILHYGGVLT